MKTIFLFYFIVFFKWKKDSFQCSYAGFVGPARLFGADLCSWLPFTLVF